MLNARLVTLSTVLVCIISLFAPALSAQESATLPPGVQSIDVDGQPLDSATIPVTNNPTPEISGRIEAGIPAIEIVVGDAEPIRFTAEVDDRGRFGAVVPQALADGQYPLAINDIPIGTFTVDSTAQVAAEEDRQGGERVLLDIARVVPYPVDFGDVLPGLGFLDGRFYTLDEEAARTAAANGGATAEALRETRRGLAAGGWLQRYENRLAVPNPENSDVFDLQVSSFVVEYASAEDATAAFATLTQDDQAVESPLVGDESVLTLLTGVTPDTGAEYQAARLIFRVGPMLAMIVYADLLGQQPDLALLDTVAQAVAARGAVVAERGSEPLGSMALQLDPSAATGRLIQRDLYDVRAGALTPLFAEAEAIREGRIELLTGTTDAFSSTTNGSFATEGGEDRGEDRGERQREQGQDRDAAPEAVAQQAEPTPTSVIAIEGESPAATAVPESDESSSDLISVITVEGEPQASPPAATPPAAAAESAGQPESEAVEQTTAQVFMTSALYGFPGELEADVWLTSQRDRLLANAESGSGTFTEVPDAPALGDASTTFATQRGVGAGEEIANGFRFYSRVGAIVAVLEIGSTSDLPLNDAARIMELQIGCIEANGCAGVASLSGRMVGGVELPETESDEEAQTEEPRPERVAEPRPERAPREGRSQQPQAPAQEPAPPAAEPTPVPVEEPTPIPIEEPTQVPVEEPTPPPIEEGTPPPAEEGTPPPAEEPTPPPAEDPTPPPAAEPTPVPGEEPTPVPGEDPTPPPAEQPTLVPVEEPTPPPAAEPTAIPTPGPIVEDDQPPADDGGGRRDDRDRDRDDDRDRDRDRDRD